VRGAAGIPVRDLSALSFLWKFATFAPAVSGPAVLADGSGEVLQVLGVDWGGDAAVRDFRLVGADSPSRRARIPRLGRVGARDRALRGAAPALRGDRLPIVAGGVRHEPRIGGLLELSGVARASGGDLILTDLFTAQELLGRRGTVDRVDIVLDRGVSKDAARREIAARLPPGLALEPPAAPPRPPTAWCARSASTSTRSAR
jgi:putative ABC transport system permease protein